VTLLHKNVFDKLCRSTGRSRLLQPANFVYSVSGQRLDVLGSTQIKVDNAAQLDVLIVNGITYEMILGHDVLNKGHGVIDYPKRTLSWFSHQWPLKNNRDNVVSAMDTKAEITKKPKMVGNKMVDRVLTEYADLFSEKDDPHGLCDMDPMNIDTQGHSPIKQRAYRTPLAKRQVIDEEVETMLKDNVIQPSLSQWASPASDISAKT